MERATDYIFRPYDRPFLETHMSDRELCRKEVYEETESFKKGGRLVRLASGHPRTPRIGAQDEAHRLTSDFELSLGAHGGAVRSASLNRQRCFCSSIEFSIQRENLHSSDASTSARHPILPTDHTSRLAHSVRACGRTLPTWTTSTVNQLLVLW